MNRKRHNNLNSLIETEVNGENSKKKKSNVVVRKTRDVNKRTIFEDDERHNNLNANKNQVNVKKAKKKKNKLIVSKTKDINKRIIFEEDEPRISPCKMPEDSNQMKDKTEQCLLEDEAAIKDEDIDKFCDELDEEDNIQYENWVKSIEGVLNSNKKKSK